MTESQIKRQRVRLGDRELDWKTESQTKRQRVRLGRVRLGDEDRRDCKTESLTKRQRVILRERES